MPFRMPTPATVARFQLLAAAVLFSSGGAAIKSCDLDALTLVAGRSAIAAFVLLAFVRSARIGWTRAILPVSVCYALTMLLFVLANKFTTAANTVFLQSTAPLYVMLVSPWLLKESINRRDFLLMGAFGIGLVIFMISTGRVFESAPRPRLGNALAAISGITWAGIVVGLRQLSQPTAHPRKDSSRGRANRAEPGRRNSMVEMGSNEGDADAAPSAVALGNLMALLICLPAAGPLLHVPLKDGLILLYLGVFQIAGAYLLLMRGVERISAFEASVLLLLEPVLSPIWAWSIHGEGLSGMTFLGGGIILLASVAQVLRPNKPMPVARVSLAPAIADPLPGVMEETERVIEANLDAQDGP